MVLGNGVWVSAIVRYTQKSETMLIINLSSLNISKSELTRIKVPFMVLSCFELRFTFFATSRNFQCFVSARSNSKVEEKQYFSARMSSMAFLSH